MERDYAAGVEILRRKLEVGEALVAGVLSGTSADGIDVVLARPSVERRAEGSRLVALESLAFATQPFEPQLAARVRSALDGAALGPREIALLGRDLGSAFGFTARRAADELGLGLDLVASHGQTVYHHDGAEPAGRASLQLGDGDFCAEAAACTVVSDFRQRDLAAGGEGAPLSALVDDLLLADAPRPLLLLNLGGMANLSYYGSRGECVAFDTGPAGSLLDGVTRRFHDLPYDEGGALASAGTPHAGLTAELCAHPFLAAAPPKSTGRDTFGSRYVDELIERAAALGIARSADLLATCASFIARSIARGLTHLPERPAELLVAGGGVHNRALLQALEHETGLPTRSSVTRGLDPDAREALVFAGLGVRALLGEPSTRPGVSGAREGRVLGKISPGTPPGRRRD
jgi:anhydro-N-acetylmuramic acid kinase